MKLYGGSGPKDGTGNGSKNGTCTRYTLDKKYNFTITGKGYGNGGNGGGRGSGIGRAVIEFNPNALLSNECVETHSRASLRLINFNRT